MIATDATLKAFLKYGTDAFAKIASSTVLRKAHGRFAAATPGLRGRLRHCHYVQLIGDRERHLAGAARERTGDRQHFVVAGELAQRVRGLRRLCGIVVNEHLELRAVD